jgi:hypothetical protein
MTYIYMYITNIYVGGTGVLTHLLDKHSKI